MATLFVSYRREDSGYAAATISDKLRQRFGAESVFFDIDTIPLGSDFRAQISDAVGKCDIFVAIIGDNWIEAVDELGHRRIDNPADSVRLEIEAALSRNIPVVPVLVSRARMPQSNALPASLRDLAFRNATEVRAGPDLQQHLARLLTGIEALLQEQDLQPFERGLPRHSAPDGSGAAQQTLLVSPPDQETQTNYSLLKRVFLCAVVFNAFGVAGVFLGNAMEEFAGSHWARYLVAVPVWLTGFALIYRILMLGQPNLRLQPTPRGERERRG